MRKYYVNKISHNVYDPDDKLPDDIKVMKDWKKSNIGDWILTDDDCVLEVLRKGEMNKAKGKNKIVEYIGTCTGTFVINNNTKIDASKRINIYSFGGDKTPEDVVIERQNLSKNEILFVIYMSSLKMSMMDAYLKAFPTNNRNYASQKAATLVKTERIKTAMKEELKPVMEKLGLDEEWSIKKLKDAAETSEKEDVRLRAVFKICDIMDLEDKNQTKVTQVTGALFKGFTPDMIDEVERPELEESHEEGENGVL
jgi:hypothetical protein